MRKPNKPYTELTREEIDRIVNTGGDAKTWLNNAVSAYLDRLKLSERARRVVNTTDPISEVFAGMYTAEEVEQYIAEYCDEEDEF